MVPLSRAAFAEALSVADPGAVAELLAAVEGARGAEARVEAGDPPVAVVDGRRVAVLGDGDDGVGTDDGADADARSGAGAPDDRPEVDADDVFRVGTAEAEGSDAGDLYGRLYYGLDRGTAGSLVADHLDRPGLVEPGSDDARDPHAGAVPDDRADVVNRAPTGPASRDAPDGGGAASPADADGGGGDPATDPRPDRAAVRSTGRRAGAGDPRRGGDRPPAAGCRTGAGAADRGDAGAADGGSGDGDGTPDGDGGPGPRPSGPDRPSGPARPSGPTDRERDGQVEADDRGTEGATADRGPVGRVDDRVPVGVSGPRVAVAAVLAVVLVAAAGGAVLAGVGSGGAAGPDTLSDGEDPGGAGVDTGGDADDDGGDPGPYVTADSLAGWAGVGGGDGNGTGGNGTVPVGDGTDGPVPRSAFPPGLGPGGVTDAEKLARAHEAALDGRSYVLRAEHREYVDGAVTAFRRGRVAVEDGEAVGASVDSFGTFRTGPRTVVADDDLDASDARLREESPDRYTDRVATYVDWFLSARESRVADAFRRDGLWYFWVTTAGDPYPGVENATAAALVDERGIVHRLHQRYDAPGGPVSASVLVEYVRIGEANATAPVAGADADGNDTATADAVGNDTATAGNHTATAGGADGNDTATTGDAADGDGDPDARAPGHRVGGGTVRSAGADGDDG